MAKKRMLSWLVAASLTLSLLPTAALAAEGETQKPENSIPTSVSELPNLDEIVLEVEIDESKTADLSEDDQASVDIPKQEVIDAVEDHNTEIAKRENNFQETVNNIQSALTEAVNAADGAYTSDFQEALNKFNEAVGSFNTAVGAKTEVVVNGEKREMTLQELLDFANGVGSSETPETTDTPETVDTAETTDAPEAGEDGDVIAQLEKAAKEAAEAAKKAQAEADAAGKTQEAAEAAAAQAAERAEAAKKAQELVDSCKTARQAIEDAMTALQTATTKNQDAIKAAISTAESNYATEKANAEKLPAPGDENGTYEEQGQAAAKKLKALRDQEKKIADLSAQLSAAKEKLNLAKGAQTAAINKNTEITNITNDHGANFKDADLTTAETQATKALQDYNTAASLETDAQAIKTALETPSNPTLDKPSADLLKTWEATYGKTGEALTYLQSDEFKNGCMDRKNNQDNPEGSKGSDWLEAKADGCETVYGPSREDVLTNYLTLSKNDYTKWWTAQKGLAGRRCFKSDPIVSILDKYDPNKAGSGLRNLMAKLGNSTDPDVKPTGVNSSLENDVKYKSDSAYTTALAQARTTLNAANDATPSQLLTTSGANANANRAKLNQLVTDFKNKYGSINTNNQYYSDTSFETVAGMTTVINNAEDTRSQAYTTAINGVNNNLVDADKLGTDATKADQAAITSKFEELRTQQNALKDAMVELSGNGTLTNGTTVDKGLLEQASDAAGNYQSAYQAYTEEAANQQAEIARVNSLKAAADKALNDLAGMQLKLNDPDLSKTLDAAAIQELQDKIAARTADLEGYTKALEDANSKLNEQTKKTEEAKEAADKAKEEADKALEEARDKAEEAAKAAEEAAQKAKEAQEALDKAKDDAAKKAAEEAAKRAQEEAEEAARLAEELRRALEALQSDDDDTAIEDGIVPLAGLIDRQILVSYLYTHEGSPDGVDAEGTYTLALAWAVAKDVVDEEDDPEEVVTVAILRDVMSRYAKLLNRTFTVEIPGEDDDIVMNCDEILTAFFAG